MTLLSSRAHREETGLPMLHAGGLVPSESDAQGQLAQRFGMITAGETTAPCLPVSPTP